MIICAYKFDLMINKYKNLYQFKFINELIKLNIANMFQDLRLNFKEGFSFLGLGVRNIDTN